MSKILSPHPFLKKSSNLDHGSCASPPAPSLPLCQKPPSRSRRKAPHWDGSPRASTRRCRAVGTAWAVASWGAWNDPGLKRTTKRWAIGEVTLNSSYVANVVRHELTIHPYPSPAYHIKSVSPSPVHQWITHGDGYRCSASLSSDSADHGCSGNWNE